MDTGSTRLPARGDVFAVPLLNGKFGAVVLVESGQEFRFLVLDGFWDARPTYEDVSALRLMRMHEIGPDWIFKGWFRPPFPESFVLLGRRSFPPKQLEAFLDPSGTMIFGTGSEFVRVLSERWRWRFDREALVAELELRRIAHEEEQRTRRESRSLETMLRERPFAHWAEQWPRSVVTKAHRIVREATRELIDLQSASDSRGKMTAVLKRIVDDFNELYNETGCIETEEAAEIVDWVQQLGSRVGISNDDEHLTGHRSW